MHWTNLEDLLKDFFSARLNEQLYIFCPFINTELITELLDNRDRVTIITSWRKDHLISGISNLDLYQVVARNPSWELFVNDRLHAKVFTNGFEDMLYGSANITKTALGDNSKSNHEFINYGDLSEEDEYRLREIIDDSIQISPPVFEKYLDWYENVDMNYNLPEPDSLVLRDLDYRFMISQLPASVSPTRIWEIITGSKEAEEIWSEEAALQHDLDLFLNGRKIFANKGEYLEAMKKKVQLNRFISTFCDQITDEGMFFGRAKEWIQSNCEDDPVPYRKELTAYVQSLFEWLTELYPEKFEIDRPSFSQRLRRIS